LNITFTKILDTTSHAEYSITVPASDITSELDTYLDRISKSVRVDGFRPGKAPKSALIKSITENRIIDTLKPHIQSLAFDQLIRSISVTPVGPPSFTDTGFRLDSDYTFTADFAKEIHKLNPTHDHHMPITGDLKGSPDDVCKKLYSDKTHNPHASDHLPDNLAQSLPDKISARASAKLADIRNPLKTFEKNKPKPGDTDTAEKLSKTTKPDEMIPEEPHKKLDKTAEPPAQEMEKKIPETSKAPETDIRKPETDERKKPGDLAKKIDSPIPKESSITDTTTQSVDSDIENKQ
jgi:hypothetical protein